jgi:hypothetical protein
MGPHQAFGNIPVSIESAVEWIGDFIEWCYKNNVTRFEAKQRQVDIWTQHVNDCSNGLLFQVRQPRMERTFDSWLAIYSCGLPRSETSADSIPNGL